ncbi:MAG: Zn-dependent exopeptidase M28 [Gemmatimonadetes bacterium]|nr:Zn-dependent exopeptidase M28 [Gemmatimonadota bacterium]
MSRGAPEENPVPGHRGAGQFDIREQLEIIAQPRLTGSEAASRITQHVRATLSGFGYDVRDHAFRFNPWPGRLGVSAAGACQLSAIFLGGGLLLEGHARAALAVLAVVPLLVGLTAVALWRWLDSAGWAPHAGLNLLALPAGRPRFLIVAHRDSKSQPIPLVVRGPAIVVALLSWALLLAQAALSLARPMPAALPLGTAAVGAVAGLLLLWCRVGNDSPGALDNASGVVALLAIARDQQAEGDVALLVTDAEEFGLAGSRAIARGLPVVTGAINLDGIDDAGPFYLLARSGGRRQPDTAPRLAAARRRAGAALNLEVRQRNTPFGILLDHIPLAARGIAALSIMRGTFRSLRRVHRPGDSLAVLSGQGIDPVRRLVRHALDLLRTQELPARTD